MIRSLIEHNRRVSRRIDTVARTFGRRDGNYAFVSEALPRLLRPGQRVLDVGGGKNPGISLEVKQRLSLTVDGLDVSEDELRRAPPGSYDEIFVSDVAQARLRQRYDLVFSCAVLEHVRGVGPAIAALANALVPGGTMVHFVPNAFAPFALANRTLGAERARQVLFSAYPGARALQGFAAYYEDCWPSRFVELCTGNGLEVVSIVPHYCSGYATFFWPLHVVDVTRQLLLMGVHATNLCESFTILARRPS